MEKFDGCKEWNANLEHIKRNRLSFNWDWLNVCWGIEGAGKTDLGLYSCAVEDEHFDGKHYVDSHESLSYILETIDRGSAVMIDEGSLILFNRDWNSRSSKELMKDFMVMRAMKLFVWINITELDFVDPYIRMTRVRSATHVTTYEFGGVRHRGYFDAYSRAAIRKYYKFKQFLAPDLIDQEFPDLRYYSPESREIWESHERRKDELIEKRRMERAQSNRELEGKKEKPILRGADYGRIARAAARAKEAARANLMV